MEGVKMNPETLGETVELLWIAQLIISARRPECLSASVHFDFVRKYKNIPLFLTSIPDVNKSLRGWINTAFENRLHGVSIAHTGLTGALHRLRYGRTDTWHIKGTCVSKMLDHPEAALDR